MQAVAIFDIGKTNKKLFLFNESYQIVWKKSVRLAETKDEDGELCENINALKSWIEEVWNEALSQKEFDIKAVNFSAYGASFVYLDDAGNVLTPLYNYLKEYPEELKQTFYQKYDGEEAFALISASPVLGSLNSGMQIYRLKNEKPELFKKVRNCLHLPQYLSFLFTNQCFTDITSIGCHTNLWDFRKMNYHEWLYKEGIKEKLPKIRAAYDVIEIDGDMVAGVGLHDSSSAIIPYLMTFSEPFVLLSTGTWSISLNPFNDRALTFEEMQFDCLSFLNHFGKPMKASRLFAGNEHEVQTKRLAEHFNVPQDRYTSIAYNSDILQRLKGNLAEKQNSKFEILRESPFNNRELSGFESYEIAYHQLILDIVAQQAVSTELVIQNSSVKKIFVDGGFSNNPIFMHLLAETFKNTEVYAASMAQASSLGAALAIHKEWNSQDLPENLIELKRY